MKIETKEMQMEFNKILNKLIKKAENSTKATAFVNGYYEALADFQNEMKNIKMMKGKGEQIMMKEFFNERELEALRGGNHGGLRFEVFQGSKRILAVNRVTIAGGLDYSNNQVDKLEAPDDTLYTVYIYKRYGSKRGQWSQVAKLERTQDSMFNH